MMHRNVIPTADESRMDAVLRLLSWQKPLLLTGASLLIAIAIGLLAAEQPLLALVVIGLASLLPIIILWTDASIIIVVFLLYTNIVVVAVKFHGLSYVVGAAFPLLLLVPLTNYILSRREQPVLYRAFPLLLLFVLVQLLGSLLARDIRTAMNNFVTFIMEGVVLYIVLINVIRTPETLRRVTWVLLIAGIFLSAIPLYQQATGTFDHTYWGFAQLSERGFRTGQENLLGEVRQFRAAGAIGEQNRYAQVMLMLVPLGLFTFISERTPLLRTLALTATAFCLLGVAITFSRGAAVAFLLLLIVMMFLRIVRPYQFFLVLLSILLILLIFPQYQVRLATLPSAATTLSEGTTSETDSSIRGRTTEMWAAALVFIDHPLLGVGPGMFKYYSQEYGNQLGIRYLTENREAHSLILDIAANHGILGLISFFGIFYITLRDLLRARKRLEHVNPRLSALSTGYMLALVSYLTTGLFLHLSYLRYLWFMLALGAAAVLIAERAMQRDGATQAGLQAAWARLPGGGNH